MSILDNSFFRAYVQLELFTATTEEVHESKTWSVEDEGRFHTILNHIESIREQLRVLEGEPLTED